MIGARRVWIRSPARSAARGTPRTSREDAEQLASRLAREVNGRNDEGRSLTVGAFLTARRLPGKRDDVLVS